MDSAKKSWNKTVISSCQYLQTNCDVRVLGTATVNASKDLYNNIVEKVNESGSETKDDPPSESKSEK